MMGTSELLSHNGNLGISKGSQGPYRCLQVLTN